MNIYPFLLLILASLQLSAQDKQLCITIDDLPTVIYQQQGFDFRMSVTRAIVDTLKEYSVPAIGYVNERKLTRDGGADSAEISLLQYWLDGGLDLGNHTYSHLNYHRVPFGSFASDLLKGERITSDLMAKANKELTYFRHPYLRIGRDQAHYDSLQRFLQQHGYIPAPVTIDNADYLFALAFSRAYHSGDQSTQDKIGRDYIEYMEQKLLFYEGQSIKLFNRHIAQTLLIHASLLNATYLNQLVAMFKQHGYTFVSQSEVLKDPAYASEVTKFGEYGISWLDRWALSRGLKGEFFKGDPETPEYIVQMTRD